MYYIALYLLYQPIRGTETDPNVHRLPLSSRQRLRLALQTECNLAAVALRLSSCELRSTSLLDSSSSSIEHYILGKL